MAFLKPGGTDQGFGLAPYTAPLRMNTYAKGSTIPCFAGDIITLLSTGLVVPMTASTTGPIVGVCAQTTVTASADTTVQVYDHPDQLYVVQDDSVGTAIAQTHFGNMFAALGFVVSDSAGVARGRSITRMDTSTASDTISFQPLVFIKLHEIENTNGFPSTAGNPRKCVVKLNAGMNIFATQGAGI